MLSPLQMTLRTEQRSCCSLLRSSRVLPDVHGYAWRVRVPETEAGGYRQGERGSVLRAPVMWYFVGTLRASVS